MFGYPHFIPEFAQNTNSFLFRFKIANELSEFRNCLFITLIIVCRHYAVNKYLAVILTV